MIKKNIFFVLLAFLFTLSFQNCGQVQVQTYQPVNSLAPKLDISVCPSLSAAGATKRYRIVKFFVLNLNYVPWKGKLMFDRDGDGLPDDAKNLSNEYLDLNPNNRRTRWGILDSVSINLSESVGTCANRFDRIGFSDCDLLAYRLPVGDSFGSDYDKDLIPNYIEVLRNTMPLNFDSTTDTDNDGKTLSNEISIGTDPHSADMIISQNLMSYSLKAASGEKCNSIQDKYKLDIKSLSFLEGPAFVDNSPEIIGSYVVDYSRTEKENVYLIGYISEPEVGQANAETYFKIVKLEKQLSKDIIVRELDFKGDVQ